MEFTVTKASFKSQAKKQHAALKSRNVELKLSDVQESLAVGLGFENLATLYAKFKDVEYLTVDATGLKKHLSNLFVITWVTDPDDEENLDEVMGIFPPGTTLDDTARTYWVEGESLHEKIIVIPDGMVFSKETVALENYSQVPNIAKYGLSDSQHHSTVCKWVHDYLGFRVPKNGVEVDCYDKGDDGCSRDHFLIWLNDEDSTKVRALFS